MADDAMHFLVDEGEDLILRDAGTALTAALPASSVAVPGSLTGLVPDVIRFVGRTHQTQELPGAPTDLPIGYHRIAWNTTTNRPSCWMNRGGTIFDAFDPGTF